ncbi:hypothetical protein ACJJTC_016940 [Scirpophaga incertulas]
MKLNALILLCALALASARSRNSHSNGCPIDWTVEKLIPHNNCHKFYQCWDGKLVVHTCPSKLYFSVEENRCEWAEVVDCTGRDEPDDNNAGNSSSESSTGGGNSDPSLASEICAAEDSEGVLVANEICNRYYICDDGKPVALSCPGNLLFNPKIDQCDWPVNVQCGDREIPNTDGDSESEDNEDNESDNDTSCNCNPGEAPNICSIENSNSVLVAHESCNKYYICCNGKPLVKSCPAILLYNPHKEICDWPENVECGDRGGLDGNSSETGGSGNGETGQPESSESNGSSESNENSGSGNDNPALAPEICAAEGSENILVAHENCNQFYICNEGTPVALRCPGNLLFNPQTDQCDWPENVNCGDREIPNTDSGEGDSNGQDNGSGENQNGTCNCDPGQAPSVCSAEGSDSVLVAHENCNNYYICSNGKPLAQSCPGNLLYNPHKEICDWPENVNCGDRDIPDGNSSGEDNSENGGNGNGETGQPESSESNGSSESNENSGSGNDNPALAPEICAAEGSENILVAHENCNQFYICNEGTPVALRCPGNLLFNPQTDKCDWPENVNCGDREIPNTDSGEGNGQNNGSGENQNATCNCDPGQAPSVCSAEGSDSVLVAHESCNNYYICSNGKPLVQSCPGNLLYNPHKEICDWPENVDCGDRGVLDSSSSETGGNGNGENGQPESSEYNSSSESNENCGSGNDNPALAPEICAAEGSENILVAHENCNQFYICNEGTPVALRCPGNLLFNPQTDQCDWPENVNCGEREIPNTESGQGDNNGQDNESGENKNGTCNCDPEQAPNVCSAEGSDSVLVAHESCNRYYICCNGKPLIQSCPTNLLYNPHKEICDWPQNVDCGNRGVPDGTSIGEGNSENSGNGDGGNGQSESSEANGSSESNENSGSGNDNPALAPEICAAEGSENVLVANENCNQFYVCNEGTPVALRCPGNLLFNPQTDQCDWPENVNCGEREIPNTESGQDDNNGQDNGSGENQNATCNCDPGQAPNVCSAEGSDSVLVAHESCNRYYICCNGKPLIQSCPTNLLYNPHKEICDWPQNVDCGDRGVPDGTSSGEGNSENSGNGDGGNGQSANSSECIDNCSSGNDNPALAPEICAAEHSEGVLVAHEKCNKFYVCNGGNPVVLRCPVNLLFNPQTGQCDWPENVNCGDREISNNDNNASDNGDNDKGSDTCNCNPEAAPEICAADNSDSILVAHESCNKYYICSNGQPLVQKCPAQLLYNPHKEECGWPENVNCDGRGSDGSCDSNVVDHDSSEESNNNIEKCQIPSGGSGNYDPSQALTICASENSTGVLIAHENCNQFYECDHGLPVVFDCPVTLLFNPLNDKCDWSHCVQCDQRRKLIKGKNENSDPSQAAKICTGVNSDGLLIAHEKCNKFYKCSEGAPVALSCPGNLLYVPSQELCDWPENVDCGGRTIDNDESQSGEDDVNGDNNDDSSKGGNDDPSLAGEICAAENSDGVLVAHENCNEFYMCSEGLPVAISCPLNLLYQPSTNQCDWPENVDCGDRVIPTFSINKHKLAEYL